MTLRAESARGPCLRQPSRRQPLNREKSRRQGFLVMAENGRPLPRQEESIVQSRRNPMAWAAWTG
jgi:hypothetical protein